MLKVKIERRCYSLSCTRTVDLAAMQTMRNDIMSSNSPINRKLELNAAYTCCISWKRHGEPKVPVGESE